MLVNQESGDFPFGLSFQIFPSPVFQPLTRRSCVWLKNNTKFHWKTFRNPTSNRSFQENQKPYPNSAIANWSKNSNSVTSPSPHPFLHVCRQCWQCLQKRLPIQTTLTVDTELAGSRQATNPKQLPIEIYIILLNEPLLKDKTMSQTTILQFFWTAFQMKGKCPEPTPPILGMSKDFFTGLRKRRHLSGQSPRFYVTSYKQTLLDAGYTINNKINILHCFNHFLIRKGLCNET